MANAFFIRLATAPSRLPRLPSSPQPCPSTGHGTELKETRARMAGADAHGFGAGGRRLGLFRGAGGKKHYSNGAQHGSLAH
jgi:hypothetical protein